MPIWLHYVTNSMHSSLNKIGVKTRFFVNQDVLVVPDYFIQDVLDLIRISCIEFRP